MKKTVSVVLPMIMLFTPVAFVAAKDGGVSGSGGIKVESHGAGIEVRGELENHIELRGRANENEIGDDRRSSTSSTSTEVIHGGVGRDHAEDDNSIEHASSTRSSTSSERREHGKTETHAGFSSFLSWFFGLPASTTVGEIRAQGGFSASSTGAVQPESKGFFRHFFESFGNLFGHKDN